MLTVACVYKAGRVYSSEDVYRLVSGIKDHLTVPYEIVCITDDESGVSHFVDHTVPIKHNLQYWWPKMQLFTLPGPVLYFDLDTVIVKNIDPLAKIVCNLDNTLLILEDFYRKDALASGVMGWGKDMTILWNAFEALLSQPHRWPNNSRGEVELRCAHKAWKGDQNLIRDLVEQLNIPTVYAQRVDPTIRSYKVHVKRDGLTDSSVVCFHGKPRPWEVRV